MLNFRNVACDLTCPRWRGEGAPGQPASLRRSGLRCAPTALRCSGSWPRRRTHCAHCVSSVQTTATEVSTKRAARAATNPALLGAPQARCRLPGRALAGPGFAFPPDGPTGGARQAALGEGEVWGDEERSARVGARSVPRGLIRGACLNGAHAVSTVSCATRSWREHRSGVCAERRPPHPELAPGAACRAAQTTSARPLDEVLPR